MVLFFFLGFSAISFGQSPEGTWLISTPDGDWTVNFKADGSFAVDIGVDGAIDLTGKWWSEGTKMTVQNDAGCTEKGVYNFGMENGQLWMDPISDACTDRNPTQKVYFKKG
jgi:hypothetical protein